MLQDIEDVTECGAASAADQTDFCAVNPGLGSRLSVPRACLCDVRRLYDQFTSLFTSERSCIFDLIVLQDHNFCVGFMCVLARFYL